MTSAPLGTPSDNFLYSRQSVTGIAMGVRFGRRSTRQDDQRVSRSRTKSGRLKRVVLPDVSQLAAHAVLVFKHPARGTAAELVKPSPALLDPLRKPSPSVENIQGLPIARLDPAQTWHTHSAIDWMIWIANFLSSGSVRCRQLKIRSSS